MPPSPTDPSSHGSHAGNRRPGQDPAAEAATSAGISPLTVNRLSVYLRSLRQLEEQGVRRVSSQQLARRFHLSSTQIRKDLAVFGAFGVRGVGYDVSRLAAHLAGLLGIDRVHRVVILGMGNVGTALARFPAFNSGNFLVVAGFDSDPAKVGRTVGPVAIHGMADLPAIVHDSGAEMAIIAVPAEAAAGAFRNACEAGLAAVLNFAPVTLPQVASCRVKNVDLRIYLEELAYFLSHAESSPGPPADGV